VGRIEEPIVSVIAVDWSGARDPRGKLWLAEVQEGHVLRLDPVDSREAVVNDLVRFSERCPQGVVGIDFAFSMPAWFVRRHGCSTAGAFWDVVAEHGESWLDHCEEPFWGRPGIKRPQSIEHFRQTELDIPGRPKSCFQVGGAGAVGTGSLRGMPFLKRLRAAGFAIWPFDPPKPPLVVEIYPRLLTGPIVKSQAPRRREYLAVHWPQLRGDLLDRAIRSEDAFDAVVSAFVMDRDRALFSLLPAEVDEARRLEGVIWAPSSVATAPRSSPPVRSLERPVKRSLTMYEQGDPDCPHVWSEERGERLMDSFTWWRDCVTCGERRTTRSALRGPEIVIDDWVHGVQYVLGSSQNLANREFNYIKCECGNSLLVDLQIQDCSRVARKHAVSCEWCNAQYAAGSSGPRHRPRAAFWDDAPEID
jgi:hypothetical protein